MCDGAASSIKALEFTAFPGMLLPKHEGTQLIITHMWERSALLASTAPGVTSAVVPAPQATGSVMLSSPPLLPSGAPLPSCNDLVRTAAACTAPDAAVVFEPTSLPSFYAVYRVLQVIQENKLTKHTLNFKLETSALVLPAALEGAADEDATKSSSPAGVTKGGKAAHGHATPASTATGVRATGKHNAVGGSEAVSSVGEPAERSPEPILAMGQQKIERAGVIVDYAAQRAAHHGATIIALGAGNGMDGKNVKVGAVARQAVQTLGGSHVLYVMKADGFTLRPSTAVVQYTVLVCLGQPPEPRTAPLETAVTSATRSKDGEADVLPQQPLEEPTTAAATTATTASLPTTGTSELAASDDQSTRPPIPAPVDSLAAGLTAARYALKCRRPSTRDYVNVVLVVDPTVAEAELATYTESFTALLQQAEPMEGSPASAPPTQNGEPPTGARPPSADGQPPGATGDAAIEDSPSRTEAVATVEPSQAAEGTETSELPVAVEAVWPTVQTCAVRPTKQNANPTVYNAAAQVVKFIQPRKSDFVVVANNSPLPLHEAVMGMMRPHVLVVPHDMRLK